MLKKIFLLIILVASLGISYAQTASDNSIILTQGWNIVSNFMSLQQINGGDIKAENIEAVYAFIAIEQKYVRLYPSPSQKDIEFLQSLDDDEIEKNSFWVYTNKAGTLKYIPSSSQMPSLESRILRKGWNFVGITSNMIENPTYPDLTFEDIKGNCKVEKVYAFLENQWITIKPFPMEDNLINSGLVVKVTNDCKLGMADQVPPSPPAIS